MLNTSVKGIWDSFARDGVDDMKVEKRGEEIVIGYFEHHPVDCVKINNNKITYIVFSKQPRLDWLFSLQEKNVFIHDDYNVLPSNLKFDRSLS